MDATEERIIKRLMQRFYEQPLINNVHRGDYVECMIALALEPAWRLTKPWTSWDLVHEKTGARIEVKQSAAVAPWAQVRPARGRFDIRLRTGYYSEDGAWTKTPQRKRHACLYVFAWHPREDTNADHRRLDQWEFFVVAETCLPPEQGSISLGPLIELVERCDLAERCGYDALETKGGPGADETAAAGQVHPTGVGDRGRRDLGRRDSDGQTADGGRPRSAAPEEVGPGA